jgi:hypothetical protein
LIKGILSSETSCNILFALTKSLPIILILKSLLISLIAKEGSKKPFKSSSLFSIPLFDNKFDNSIADSLSLNFLNVIYFSSSIFIDYNT